MLHPLQPVNVFQGNETQGQERPKSYWSIDPSRRSAMSRSWLEGYWRKRLFG